MFVGHLALGFAAKKVAPRTSLGTLLAASELADLLFPVLALLGWEQVSFAGGPNPFLSIRLEHYPISHSLLALVAWGVAFGIVYRVRTAYLRGTAVVFALVVSHWVLDFITHVPDMPLWPGGPKVGLGLWASVPGTLIVEGLLFAAGLVIYARATRVRDAIGRFGLWTFAALLLALYAESLSGGNPTGAEFAIGSIVGGWAVVFLGAWIDRHREAKGAGG